MAKHIRDHMTTHHDMPKFRGGWRTPGNEVQLWRVRHHDPYHLLFGGRTFVETAWMLRAAERYRRQGVAPAPEPESEYLVRLVNPDERRRKAYRCLFGERSLREAARVCDRLAGRLALRAERYDVPRHAPARVVFVAVPATAEPAFA